MPDLDFRLSVGYTDSPKIRRLTRKHGIEAMVAHLRLLSFTRTDRSSGVLTGLDADDLAEVMRWPGDGRELVATMTELRLLDEREDGTLEVHDWARWNNWAVTEPRRQQAARQNVEKRWAQERARTKAPPPSDTTRNTTGNAGRNTPLPPSPSLTSPNPTSPSPQW